MSPPARAVVVSPKRVVWEAVDLPDRPGPGMVRLAATRSLISPGTERALYEGRPMVDGLNSAFAPSATSLVLDAVGGRGKQSTGQLFPVVLGYNLAGVVVDVGRGVSSERVETAAFALARHQSVVDIAEWEAIPMLADVPPHIAAMCYIPTLGLSALRRVGYQVGDTVAVVGLGLVGLSAALVAESLGARAVLFETSSRRRAFAARLVDADAVVDPRDVDAVDRVLETHGEGFDIVVEATGARASLAFAAEVAAVRGRLAVLGLHSEDLGALFARNFYRKSLQLVFCTNDAYAPPARDRLTIYDNVQEVARLERRGRLPLSQLVTAEVGANRITEAFDMLAEDDGFQGVVLDWESPERPVAPVRAKRR